MRIMMWLIGVIVLCAGYVQGMLDPKNNIPWEKAFRSGNVRPVKGNRNSVEFMLENSKSIELPIVEVRKTIELLKTPPDDQDDTAAALQSALQNSGIARFVNLEYIKDLEVFNPDTFDYEQEMRALEARREKQKISHKKYALECASLQKFQQLQQELKKEAANNPTGPTPAQRWQNIIDSKRRVTKNYLAAWEKGDSEEIARVSEQLRRRHEERCDLCCACDYCLTKCLVS